MENDSENRGLTILKKISDEKGFLPVCVLHKRLFGANNSYNHAKLPLYPARYLNQDLSLG